MRWMRLILFFSGVRLYAALFLTALLLLGLIYKPRSGILFPYHFYEKGKNKIPPQGDAGPQISASPAPRLSERTCKFSAPTNKRLGREA